MGTVGGKTVPCLKPPFLQNRMELGNGSSLGEEQWATDRGKGSLCRVSTPQKSSALRALYRVIQGSGGLLGNSSG